MIEALSDVRRFNPDELSRARLKLSRLLAHFAENELLQSRKNMDAAEYQHKQRRGEIWKEYRSSGKSATDSKEYSDFESLEFYKARIDAKSEYKRYELLYETCRDILNSLSSRINSLRDERMNSA